MTTETKAAFLATQQAIEIGKPTQAYYRSKLFIAPYTSNPMLAAASPLLSILERLNISPTLPPPIKICANLEHELQAFHCRLTSKAYAEELGAIAHYLLCATIDELLEKNYLRLYKKPDPLKLFTPLAKDTEESKRGFFELVDYIKEKPNQYLDLIELAYYSLMCFSGVKNHEMLRLERDKQVLQKIITEYRVDKAHTLFKPHEKAKIKSKRQGFSLLMISILLILYLTGRILSLNLLENKVKALELEHPIIAVVDN